MHTPGPLHKSFHELTSRLDYVNKAWTAESHADLLRFFVEAVPTLMGAERCSVFVLEPASGRIRTLFGTELDEGIEAPAEGSVVGEVISSGEARVENELDARPGFHHEADLDTGFVTRSSVCAPIRGVSGGRVSGAVEVLNKPGGFDDADCRRLLHIAAHLNVALENIVLNGEIRRISETLRREVSRLRSDYLGEVPFIAESPGMRSVLELVGMVCDTPVNVLITGENGTGKEVIARMIHEGRDRRARPFVPVNCAAIPEHLMESEFFGYEKGAFTGAQSSRKGRFEDAEGGTLFLDEVTDLPGALQPKFLRALQESEGTRLGSGTAVKYRFDLISATNRDLRSAMADGAFREDLFYRLFAVEIPVPALRDRREDIAPLAAAFVEDVCRQYDKPLAGVSSELIETFEGYAWPGNVRQLRREVERLVALTPPGEPLSTSRCSPGIVRAGNGPDAGDDAGLSIPARVERLERGLITTAMERTGANKVQASRLLGITRQGLHKKIKRYGLDV